MGFSTNTTTYAGGAQTFPVSFALDFLDRSHVKVFVVDELDGGGGQVYRAFTWNSDTEILVTDALTVSDQVTVERTVSKTVLEVDFNAAGTATRQNLSRQARHAFHAVHEFMDGRLTQFTDFIASLAPGVPENATIVMGPGNTFIEGPTVTEIQDAEAEATASAASAAAALVSQLAAAASAVAAAASAVLAAAFDPAAFLAKADNLSGLASTGTSRTNLGVDVAGTDNSTDVTLAGAPNYLTIAGQAITRTLINLTSHVTGVLPSANMAVATLTASGAVEKATTAEAQAGTEADKFPDVVGVAAAISALAAGGGWEFVDNTYNFGVDGVVATIETSAWADGYEYAFAFEDVDHNAGTNQSLTVEVYKSTSAAYHPNARSISAAHNSPEAFGWMEFVLPRTDRDLHILNIDIFDTNNITMGTDDAESSTSASRLVLWSVATTQKLGKARFSWSAGSISGGKILMYRRPAA